MLSSSIDVTFFLCLYTAVIHGEVTRTRKMKWQNVNCEWNEEKNMFVGELHCGR